MADGNKDAKTRSRGVWKDLECDVDRTKCWILIQASVLQVHHLELCLLFQASYLFC